MTPHGSLLSMRLRRIRNHVFSLEADSITKILVVLFGLSTVIAIGLWVSLRCFEFTDNLIFGAELNAKLIGLLFYTLTFLVCLSTIIIAFTSLFIAKETEFLFQHPVPPRTILFLKCFEAISFSAWASLFLCMPVLVSYGIVRQVPWTYYLEATGILATFLCFSGLIGCAIALLIAPIVRRLSPKLLLVAGIMILAMLSWIFLRSFNFWAMEGNNNILVLDRFMSGLRMMQSPYFPSYWASTGIFAAAGGDHDEVLFQWGILLANFLILIPLLSIYGNRFFGSVWIAGKQQQQRSPKKRRREISVKPHRALSPIRSLVHKDILVFLRNPAQVSQSLLFLLLMVIYSLSLLHLPQYISNFRIKIFVHFANIGAVCLILSSFTSRFLFPLLSLEGRAFWVLGLAPMSRWTILGQKVVFGLAISLSLGLLTIVASNFALESNPQMFLSAIYTMLLGSTCLTCLATGLGAAYPNFDEDNPARIAAGLGGTLNFFASAISVACVVAIELVPYLIYPDGAVPGWAILLTHLGSFLFTAVVSFTVLRMGGRALARSEF